MKCIIIVGIIIGFIHAYTRVAKEKLVAMVEYL